MTMNPISLASVSPIAIATGVSALVPQTSNMPTSIFEVSAAETDAGAPTSPFDALLGAIAVPQPDTAKAAAAGQPVTVSAEPVVTEDENPAAIFAAPEALTAATEGGISALLAYAAAPPVPAPVLSPAPVATPRAAPVASAPAPATISITAEIVAPATTVATQVIASPSPTQPAAATLTAAAAPKAPTTTSAPAGTKAPPEQTPVTAPPGKTRQKTPGQPQLVPALPRPIINTPPARQPKSGEPTQPQALITVPGLTVPGPTPPTDTPSNPVGAPIAQGTPKQPAPVDTGGPLLVSVPTPLPGADADAPPVPASAPSNTPAPAVSPLPFIVENLPAPIAPEGETAAPVAVSITASAKPAVPTATVVQQPAPAAPIATDVEAVTVLTAKTDAAPAAQPTPVSSPQVSTVSPATPQPVVAAASAPTETASTGSDATDSATAAPAQPAAPVMTAAVATPAPVAVEAAPFAESLAPALSEALAEKQLDLAAGDAWLDDLARDIVRTAGNEGPLRFRLNPETLGSLAIHVERRDDGAAIRIEADTEAAARVLSEAQPRLFAEARAQGLRIAESTVDHTHQQNASSQGQPQQQNGQTQQNAQNPQAQLASGNHPAPQNFGGQSGNHQRSSEDQKPFLVRDQVNAQTVSESEGPQAERYA